MYPASGLRRCPNILVGFLAQARYHCQGARTRGLAMAAGLRRLVAVGVTIVARTSVTCRSLGILLPSPIPSVIQLGSFLPNATPIVQRSVPTVSPRIPIPTHAMNEVIFDNGCSWKPVTADGAGLVRAPTPNPSVIFLWPMRRFNWRSAGLQRRTQHDAVDCAEFGPSLNLILKTPSRSMALYRLWYRYIMRVFY